MSAKDEVKRQPSSGSVITQDLTDEAFFAGGTGDAGSADTRVRTDAFFASERTTAADLLGGPDTAAISTSFFAGGTGDADKSVRAPIGKSGAAYCKIRK